MSELTDILRELCEVDADHFRLSGEYVFTEVLDMSQVVVHPVGIDLFNLAGATMWCLWQMQERIKTLPVECNYRYSAAQSVEFDAAYSVMTELVSELTPEKILAAYLAWRKAFKEQTACPN